MKRIVRLTESELVRLVKRVINEDESANVDSQEQKQLYKFLTGILKISPYNGMGVGWIPSTSGEGTRLTQNLLGSYFPKYTRDIYGMTVKPNQPLRWVLFPGNPDQIPQADGVSCYITGNAGKLYIEINKGKRMQAMLITEGGGFVSTPGVVESSLETLKKIHEIYEII